MSVDTIITEIEKLNVLELVELTKTLQDKWGVSAAPVAASGPAVAVRHARAGAGGDAPVVPAVASPQV